MQIESFSIISFLNLVIKNIDFKIPGPFSFMLLDNPQNSWLPLHPDDLEQSEWFIKQFDLHTYLYA